MCTNYIPGISSTGFIPSVDTGVGDPAVQRRSSTRGYPLPAPAKPGGTRPVQTMRAARPSRGEDGDPGQRGDGDHDRDAEDPGELPAGAGGPGRVDDDGPEQQAAHEAADVALPGDQPHEQEREGEVHGDPD